MNFNTLLEKQQIYIENLHLIPKDVLEKVQAVFHVEFTHNSTAIEGNTLTLIETKVVLEDNVSIGGKKLREIYEVVNNHKATLYVEKCVANGLSLDEKIVKDIHAIINENIMVGGVYRNEIVAISGASFRPPAGQKMHHEVKKIFADLSYRTDLNPIELAAWTHAEFVRIHPFIDGNGRTLRQIMNYQLMIGGFPPISVSAKNKLAYYEALDKYGSEKDLQPFTEFLTQLAEERLDEFLEIIALSKENESIQIDVEGEVMEQTYLEVNLPDFLKESIDELVKCREQNLTIREDCHYMDTQSSINIAFVENLIDEAQANYLRDKYLYQKEM